MKILWFFTHELCFWGTKGPNFDSVENSSIFQFAKSDVLSIRLRKRMYMKLVYKGLYKSKEQLPRGELPENAVEFKGPKSLFTTVMTSFIFIIPTWILISLFIAVSDSIYVDKPTNYTVIGGVVAIIAIIPHELIHALMHPKKAEVDLFLAPQFLAMFVVSAEPTRKSRFICLLLFPSVILGWLPLTIWMALPYTDMLSSHLYTFAVAGVLISIGDYLNAFNAMLQMPRGSMHQGVGTKSFWFTP